MMLTAKTIIKFRVASEIYVEKSWKSEGIIK